MNIIKYLIRFLIFLGKPLVRLLELFFLGIKKINKKVIILIILLVVIVKISYFGLVLFKDLPDVNLIYNPPKLSTKIYDRNGVLLYKFYENENRSWINLDKIPKKLIEATLAIEDKEFYKHKGISIKGIVRALIYNYKNSADKKVMGGSTISQQLVKNVFLTNEKSWDRKIKEAILTLVLESKLSKDEILERYFNQISYGGEAYGVGEAAVKYFDKDLSQLNEAQLAFLAGLPAAPSSYSPFGSNPELGMERQRKVIQEMVSANFITKEEAEKISQEKIEIVKSKQNIKAPHFVFYVKKILEDKYGYQNFATLGLNIYTSLDLTTQKKAEEIVKSEIDKVKNLKISNGAAIVIDVKNGDILAMVGSKDYLAKDIDGQVNITTSLRQPGSSIKPINYLLALQMGKTMETKINDSPVTYYVKGQKPYSPKNYTGKYLGTVTLKTALASSLNVPSVKLLAEDGVNNMINLAETMGITTWTNRSNYGLSLALGSAEVKMTEMAQAYSVFANLGDKVEINPILRVENYKGEKVYAKEVESQKIIDQNLALSINQTLSDNQARSPIFGLNSKLKIEGKTVAVKTGTTNNLKDNWCIGWTPSYLVATWVGNNDGTPMSQVASGVSGATPIWNLITQEMLKNKTDENWYTSETVNLPSDKVIFEDDTNKVDQSIEAKEK